MALIKCPYCGAEISDKAHKCIKCNKPINQKMYLRLIIIFGIIVTIIIVLSLMVGKIKEVNRKKQIEISQNNYAMAQEYENQNDYFAALDYYKMVILEDDKNYKKSEEKIKEIEELLTQSGRTKEAVRVIKELYPTVSNAEVVEVYIANGSYLLASDEINIKFDNSEDNEFYTYSNLSISEFSSFIGGVESDEIYNSKVNAEDDSTVIQWKISPSSNTMFSSTIDRLYADSIGYVYQTVKNMDVVFPVGLLTE